MLCANGGKLTEKKDGFMIQEGQYTKLEKRGAVAKITIQPAGKAKRLEPRRDPRDVSGAEKCARTMISRGVDDRRGRRRLLRGTVCAFRRMHAGDLIPLQGSKRLGHRHQVPLFPASFVIVTWYVSMILHFLESPRYVTFCNTPS